jgi:hypothetical protein
MGGVHNGYRPEVGRKFKSAGFAINPAGLEL